MDADFLIVGQGLAGSLLAWELLRGGASVVVIDDESPRSASKVAAGIINPVSGKRLTIPAGFDEQHQAAVQRYRELEAQLEHPFYRTLPQRRIFCSAAQRTVWRQRGFEADSPSGSAPLDLGHGSASLDGTAQVNIAAIVDAIREELERRHSYVRARFDYAKLKPGERAVRYAEMRARRLIFCEGGSAVDNPWFPGLPLQPSVGEVLTVKIAAAAALDSRTLLNWGHWLLPLGDGIYRLGATHRWDMDRVEPTTSGREQLINSLRKLLPDSIEINIESHVAGLRPSTSDRRPLIGMHARHPRLGIFNGFGGKGALTIPAAAGAFAEQLLNGADGLPRVNA